MSQSKFGSFFESILAALVAAPSAMILHWYMLELWGNNLGDQHLKQMFVTISWLSFFFHSIVWKFILRRIFDKYGFKLEPTVILAHLRGRL